MPWLALSQHPEDSGPSVPTTAVSPGGIPVSREERPERATPHTQGTPTRGAGAPSITGSEPGLTVRTTSLYTGAGRRQWVVCEREIPTTLEEKPARRGKAKGEPLGAPFAQSNQAHKRKHKQTTATTHTNTSGRTQGNTHRQDTNQPNPHPHNHTTTQTVPIRTLPRY